MSDVGDKCSFFDVGGGDGHLVIGHRQLERREDNRAGKGVECLIEPRQRKTIELCRFVYATIFDAHAPNSVLFLNHYDGQCPRGCRRVCDVRVHQLLEFTLDGDALVFVKNAMRRLEERTRVAGVDLKKYNVSGSDF